MLDQQLHEQVSIAKLLLAGGLVKNVAEGQAAIAKGKVYVEHWNIGVPHCQLPRWVLRGVTIRIGDRSISVSEDGRRLHRNERMEATL